MSKFFEKLLFFSRWLLVPLYVGLAGALGVYCIHFGKEFIEMFMGVSHQTTDSAMLALLGLVDIVMVANLVVMVNIGGYSIFIREIEPGDIKGRPRFMLGITSSGLKTKMGSSLVGVSSIHLLKLFIRAAGANDPPAWSTVIMAASIHLIFVFSTIALAWVENKHHHPQDAQKDSH